MLYSLPHVNIVNACTLIHIVKTAPGSIRGSDLTPCIHRCQVIEFKNVNAIPVTFPEFIRSNVKHHNEP